MPKPHHCADLLKRFGRDRSGAIAPTFGIAFALLVVPMVGASIDVSRAVGSRNTLQDAVDGAALAVSKMPQNSDPNTVKMAAVNWISVRTSKDPNLGAVSVNVKTTYAKNPGDSNTISVSADSSINPLFVGAVAAWKGIATIPVHANSTTTWGVTKLEVALVLDNTGSMNSNNKIQTLISSANQLVSTLFQQTPHAPDNLRISVVPFSQTVNVGSQYQSQSWISPSLPPEYQKQLNSQYPGLSWPDGDDISSPAYGNRLVGFQILGTSWGGCVESRPAPYDAQDVPPNVAHPETLFVPYFAPDEPDKYFYNNTTYTNQYANNYLPDVSNDYNSPNDNNPVLWQGDVNKYNGTVPTTGSAGLGATGYKLGPNFGCQIAPLLRLTNNQQTITNTINSMTAVGDTNLNIGMMWGWHTLSPSAPFGDGLAYGTKNLQKIIVFLTDGWNEATPTPNYGGSIGYPDFNQSYYSGIGYIWQNRAGVGLNSTVPQRQAALDARTAAVCANIANAGIVVYTVRIDVAGSQSPVVLQNCASQPSYFYDVPNVQNLPATFSKIATSIGGLRLSQ